MARSTPAANADGAAAEVCRDDIELAFATFRELVLSAEEFRAAIAESWSVGVRETEAMSYLRARGPLNHRQLGEAMRLTPGSVTALVDRMEKHGLARRIPSITNRRVVVIELTDDRTGRAEAGRLLLLDCLRSVEGATSTETIRVMQQLTASLRERAASV